jgi:hypothetical protein
MVFQSKLTITTRGRGTTNISEAIGKQVHASGIAMYSCSIPVLR